MRISDWSSDVGSSDLSAYLALSSAMTRSARNERLRARAARSWTQRARLASSARSTPDSSRVAATGSRSSSGPAGGVIEGGIGVVYAPPLQRRGGGGCGGVEEARVGEGGGGGCEMRGW